MQLKKFATYKESYLGNFNAKVCTTVRARTASTFGGLSFFLGSSFENGQEGHLAPCRLSLQ